MPIDRKLLVSSEGKLKIGENGQLADKDCCCGGACCLPCFCEDFFPDQESCEANGGTWKPGKKCPQTEDDINPCCSLHVKSLRLQGSIVGSVDCSPCDGFVSFDCSFDHTWNDGDDFDGTSVCACTNIDVAVNFNDASGCIGCPGPVLDGCASDLSIPWGSYNINAIIYDGTVHLEIGGVLFACGAAEFDNGCGFTGGSGFFVNPTWADPNSPGGPIIVGEDSIASYSLTDSSDPNVTYSATLTVTATGTRDGS